MDNLGSLLLVAAIITAFLLVFGVIMYSLRRDRIDLDFMKDTNYSATSKKILVTTDELKQLRNRDDFIPILIGSVQTCPYCGDMIVDNFSMIDRCSHCGGSLEDAEQLVGLIGDRYEVWLRSGTENPASQKA